MPVETLPELFQRAVHEHGPRAAMRVRDEEDWRPITYAQFGRLVEEATVGLVEAGVEPGDRVAVIGENGPLWAIADFAILHAGATTVPVYPTLRAEAMADILSDAGATVAFVQAGDPLDKVNEVADELDDLTRVYALEGGPVGEIREREVPGVEATGTVDDLYGAGRRVIGSATDPGFEERWRGVEPDDRATLVYTSGTTGEPKGVELTHRNITSNVRSFSRIADLDPGDRHLSVLPLSHAFERTVGHFGGYHNGLEVFYARSPETLHEDLLESSPNLLLGVPRLLEKMKARFDERLAESEPGQRRLFEWALGVGEAVVDAEQEGDGPGLGLRVRSWLADRLVLGKVRAAMGIDAVELAASGGAALDPEVARWFHAIGVPVLEGYGQTEAGPVISVNRPDEVRLGSVGPPIPGVDVRIDESAVDREGEGEILARGQNIMRGYWNTADATGSTLTEDGWLRTGDVGRLDADGFLYVTDRLKELFKTAYGKYVAPEHVAGQLKRDPLVDQVLVLGAERKYVAALIQPAFEALERFAEEHGMAPEDRSSLTERERVRERFQRALDEANERLDRHEQVKRFALVAEPWEAGDELTPTLKPKRRVLEERFADEIEALYSDE